MKIVFIKEYKGFSLDGTKGVDEYKPLDEAFVLRKFGQKMIMNEFAIPEFRKELNPEYKRLVKEREKWMKQQEQKKNAVKDVDKEDVAEKKPKKRKYRKKTISKTAEMRETATTQE